MPALRNSIAFTSFGHHLSTRVEMVTLVFSRSGWMTSVRLHFEQRSSAEAHLRQKLWPQASVTTWWSTPPHFGQERWSFLFISVKLGPGTTVEPPFLTQALLIDIANGTACFHVQSTPTSCCCFCRVEAVRASLSNCSFQESASIC